MTLASLQYYLRSAAIVATLIAAFIVGANGANADSTINKTFLSGAAIEGYDPVAYFTMGEPVEGNSSITHDWMGATWHFVNSQNRDAFAADPQKYAPQYGGYCAWAVSQGYTAKVDPTAWAIADGRLFLNYSKSVQQMWSADVSGNITKGDSNWPKIRAELAQ